MSIMGKKFSNRFFGIKEFYLCFLFGPPILLLLLAVVFCGYTIFGLWSGHVPAVTAIFHFVPVPKLLSLDLALPGIMFLWALGGAGLSWLISTRKNPGLIRQFRKFEIHLNNFLRSWGFFLIIFLFVFSLARGWASPVTETNAHDYTYYSASFGFVPWSDAHGYYSGALHLADTGKLDSWNQRRPLNAALFSIRLAITRFHPRAATLIQVLLLAGTSYLAVRVFGEFLGIWSAVGMLTFLFAYGRLFQATTLSESLGISFGNLGFSLLFGGMRKHNVWLTGAGLFGVSLGMGARVGALFMLPCLWLWLCWYFRSSRRTWFRGVLISGLALLLGFGWTFFLNTLYGTGENFAGSNFAYTACGLALGVSWKEVEVRYADELSQLNTAKEQMNFLYQQAWYHIRQQPMIFIKELWRSEWLFLWNIRPYLHEMLFSRTNRSGHIIRKIEFAILLGCLALGIGVYFTRNCLYDEWGFWIACAAGLCLSIPFIFLDGGWRVIAVSWPFIAAFLASGLASPFSSVSQTKDERLHHTLIAAKACVLALAIGALAGPWIVYSMTSRPKFDHSQTVTDANTLIIRGRRQFATVAVIGEDALPIEYVPNISILEYKTALSKHACVEDRHSLINPVPPYPFLLSASYDFIDKQSFFLISSIKLGEQEAPFLKLKVRQWRNSKYFWYVTDLEKWPADLSAE